MDEIEPVVNTEPVELDVPTDELPAEGAENEDEEWTGETTNEPEPEAEVLADQTEELAEQGELLEAQTEAIETLATAEVIEAVTDDQRHLEVMGALEAINATLANLSMSVSSLQSLATPPTPEPNPIPVPESPATRRERRLMRRANRTK